MTACVTTSLSPFAVAMTDYLSTAVAEYGGTFFIGGQSGDTHYGEGLFAVGQYDIYGFRD